MPTLYPTAPDTDTSLYLVKPGLKCTLVSDPGAGGATITVDSTTGFSASGVIAIEAEDVAYTSLVAGAFQGCTRGFENTTASAHPINTPVYGTIAADHHNALKDAVKALEAKVGVNSGGSTGTSIDAGQLAAGSTAPTLKFGGTLNLGMWSLGDGASANSRLILYDDLTNIAYFTYDASTFLRLKMSGGPFTVTSVPSGANRFNAGTDIFKVTNAGLVAVPAAAATATGIQLNAASTVRSGAGAPSNAIGVDGDFWLRNDGGGAGATHIYYRNAGAYIGIA